MARPAASFARVLALLLALGVLALHLPLDALRARATGPAARCCARGEVAAADQDPGPDAGPDDCGPDACCPDAARDGAPRTVAGDAPGPTDGCDPGCHCGCCGGVPLVADVGPTAAPEAPGAPRPSTHRPRVRRAPPLEVFHPPRA